MRKPAVKRLDISTKAVDKEWHREFIEGRIVGSGLVFDHDGMSFRLCAQNTQPQSPAE